MSTSDPFEAVETITENPEATPKKQPALPEGESKIVTTLKGGAGYDAPWIVIHSNTPEEALAVLEAESVKRLIDQTKKVASYFSGSPARDNRKAPGVKGKPKAATTPPAGSPACPEGWSYRTGISKAGKPWQAYFPPKGVEGDPIWL